MATASNIVQSSTVAASKKSLLWIPFFDQLHWSTGNLLINHNNRIRAHDTIAEMVNVFKGRKISFWMFPKGICSCDRGLLPSKTGTFRAAIVARVPIIPVYVLNTSNKTKLNRWDNGLVIIEILLPVNASQFGKDNVRVLTTRYHELMAAKTIELDSEVTAREVAGKS